MHSSNGTRATESNCDASTGATRWKTDVLWKHSATHTMADSRSEARSPMKPETGRARSESLDSDTDTAEEQGSRVEEGRRLRDRSGRRRPRQMGSDSEESGQEDGSASPQSGSHSDTDDTAGKTPGRDGTPEEVEARATAVPTEQAATEGGGGNRADGEVSQMENRAEERGEEGSSRPGTPDSDSGWKRETKREPKEEGQLSDNEGSKDTDEGVATADDGELARNACNNRKKERIDHATMTALSAWDCKEKRGGILTLVHFEGRWSAMTKPRRDEGLVEHCMSRLRRRDSKKPVRVKLEGDPVRYGHNGGMTGDILMGKVTNEGFSDVIRSIVQSRKPTRTFEGEALAVRKAVAAAKARGIHRRQIERVAEAILNREQAELGERIRDAANQLSVTGKLLLAAKMVPDSTAKGELRLGDRLMKREETRAIMRSGLVDWIRSNRMQVLSGIMSDEGIELATRIWDRAQLIDPPGMFFNLAVAADSVKKADPAKLAEEHKMAAGKKQAEERKAAGKKLKPKTSPRSATAKAGKKPMGDRLGPASTTVRPPSAMKRKYSEGERSSTPVSADASSISDMIASEMKSPRTETILTSYHQQAATQAAMVKVLRRRSREEREKKKKDKPLYKRYFGLFWGTAGRTRNDLATVTELIANLESKGKKEVWGTWEYVRALDEAMRGEANDWWDSEAAAEARREGWTAIRAALIARFPVNDTAANRKIDRFRKIPKPATWGTLKASPGSAEIRHAMGEIPEDECPVLAARPLITLQTVGEERAVEQSFLMDTGVRFSSVTPELFRQLRDQGAVISWIALEEEGGRSDIALIHLQIPGMGDLILRAEVRPDVRPAIGRVDVHTYRLVFDPATKTVRSTYFDEEFAVTMEEPQTAPAQDFREGRPQTAC